MSRGHRALALLACVAGCGRLIDLDDKTLLPPPVEAPSAWSSQLPTRPPPGSGDDVEGEYLAFAARHVWVGTSEPTTHAPSPSAWRTFGFDLDGEATSLAQSAMGTACCQRGAGSSPDVLVDGEDGRDNALAARLLPLLALIHPTLGAIEPRLNDALDQQKPLTFLAVLRDLSPGTDDAHVSLGLFTGYVGDGDGSRYATEGEHPTWQGIERIQPDYRTTRSGSVVDALTLIDGYLTGDTFVSNDLDASVGGPILLPFDPENDGLLLHARRLVLSITLSRDHHEALSATLAGAFDVADLAHALLPLARARGYLPACGKDGEGQLAALIVQAADLRFGDSGALVRDPSQPCNAVSFGWHLDLQREALPQARDYAYPPTVTSDCPP